MKLLTEYMDRALHFEHLAAAEKNQKLKEQLVEQAKAYRKLAAKRAHELGVKLPAASPENSN